MSEAMQHTSLMICTTCLFCITVIGGLFLSNAATLWLKNRREAREAARTELDIRMNSYAQQERSQWIALVDEREKRIKELSDEVSRLSTLCDISKKLLEESENARLKGTKEE